MKPGWDCRDEADRDRLEAWTLQQLEPLEWRTLSDDQYREMKMADARFVAPTEERFGQMYRRGRIIMAVNDLNALIGDDPELYRLAMSKLRRIGSGRGRRKGERRPGDLSREHQRRCEVALQDVPRIRQAWQHRFGKTNRREEPTALQIAAHAHGLDESDLIAFRKRSR